MEWATHDHRPAPRPDPPAPVLVELCWRVVVGPDGHVFACGIYLDSWNRLEVRYGSSASGLLHSQVVANHDQGRALARDWLDAVKRDTDQ